MSDWLSFTKMHGLGNDFLVVDNVRGDIDLPSGRVRALADRHTGIGFDQLLVVAAPSREGCEFDYRIYNADGGEVEHCGNGARCFARFVRDRGLSDSECIVVNTAGGVIELHVRDDGQVTVNMGVPTFKPAEVPFLADGEAGSYPIDVDGERLEIGVVGIGNPHVVLRVDDVDTAPVDRLGPALSHHPRFPARVNAGFLQVIDRQRVRLRVHERGVGETRACGTGACAAVAIGQRHGWLDEQVVVVLSGGELLVSRRGAGNDVTVPIEMTGPCSTVFEGRTRM